MRAALIGDEVTAAGFKLAGARVYVPAEDDIEQVFQRALTENDFLLITAEWAHRLPTRILTAALLAEKPLILLVPDAQGAASPPDLVTTTRRNLGVES